MKKIIYNIRNSRAFFSFIGLLILIVVCSLASPDFAKINNFITILRQASIYIVVSAGLTAVILLGEIDLSIGATAALVGCFCALLLKNGMSTFIVVPVGLVLGAIIGSFNGFLVSIVRLPSFVATYATSWIVKGLAVIIMNGQIIFGMPDTFSFLGTGYIANIIPVIIVIALIVVVFCYIFLQRTTFGRDIYFTGSNKDAARFSGINIRRTQFTAFMLSSMFAGLAGLLMASRLDAAEASMGDSYGLNTIAVVVIGGTSMLGGEGGIIGTVVGAILMILITNIMNLLAISSFAQPAVIGVVIILMVLLDSVSKNREKVDKKRVVTNN